MFEEEKNTQNETYTEVNTTQEKETVVSEPYRYKYENGEKRYDYNTFYGYESNASNVTVEAPKKKKQEKEKTSTEAKADKKALATEGQLSYIKGLVSRLSMADEVFQSEFGCMPYDTNITMSDARKIIDRLKEIEEEGLPF